MTEAKLFETPAPPEWPMAAIESIYKEYPRKTSKPLAVKSIRLALDRIASGELDGEPRTVPDSVTYLRARTIAFAQAVALREKKHIPHPATYYNQRRYIENAKLALPRDLQTCKAVLNAYPGINITDSNVDAFGDALRMIEAQIEELRPTHGPMGGDFIKWRVELFASCVRLWPDNELQFVPSAKTFFSERRWNQDEKLWARSFKEVGYEVEREQAKRVYTQ